MSDIVSPVHHNVVTVLTTATQMTTTARPLKRGMLLKAGSGNAVSIFIGGPNVTTATGFPLAANEGVLWPTQAQELVYAICASGSPTVAWAAG